LPIAALAVRCVRQEGQMLEFFFVSIAFGIIGGVHLLARRAARRNKLPKIV
jgi:hypothetical protein